MAANNPDTGRNLSREINEMTRRMNEISEDQARMEVILQDMRESLHLISGNRGTNRVEEYVNVSSVTAPMCSTVTSSIARGLREQPPQMTSMVMPIGEGYRTLEGALGEIHGYAGPTWEQPHVSVPGQVTLPCSGNSHVMTEKGEMKEEWMKKMEEQIKAIKGPNAYGRFRIEDLCPTTDVIIPKGFKIPDFAKYDGSGNPRFHLISYGTTMAVWSKDDKFLISFFHESLTGPALEWYLQLDLCKISRWTELANLFMDQYKFNLDAAPTREQLSSMQKGSEETFKQYAQRWRALAAQVQPLLTLTEMCSYFLGTLGAPYIEIMAGAVYRDLADLVAAGERIEVLVKAGKLETDNNEGGYEE